MVALIRGLLEKGSVVERMVGFKPCFDNYNSEGACCGIGVRKETVCKKGQSCGD